MYVCAHLHAGVGNRLFQLAGAAQWAQITGRQFVWVDNFVEDPVHNLMDNVWLREMVNIPQLSDCASLSIEKFFTQQSSIESKADLVVLQGYSFEGIRVDSLRPQIQDQIDRVSLQKNLYNGRCFFHVRLGDYDQSSTQNAFNIFSTNMLNYYKEALSQYAGPLLLITNGILKSELLDILEGRDIVEGPSDPREAFEAMIQCTGGICANSTQSWMAAYFQSAKSGKEAPLMIPKPWARLQDWNEFTSHFKREEPMTDRAMQHPNFMPVVQETHNWTRVEFAVIGSITLGILCLLAFVQKLQRHTNG